MTTPEPSGPKRRVRWWPAMLILAAVAIWLLIVWLALDVSRQWKVTSTVSAGMIGLAALLLWVAAFSRLRAMLRLCILAGVVAVAVLVPVLFRFGGVTGDLVPILEPRWRTVAAPDSPAIPAARPHGAQLPAAGTPDAEAKDFPQFLGPTRDGVIRGTHLTPDWSAEPPASLWRQPIGEGYGGFAIAGDRAVTQEQSGDAELVTCRELRSGRRLWEHAETGRYDNPVGGVGPRATPTIVGTRVYSLGGTGWLTCLELETGSLVWRTQTVPDATVRDLEWGISSSPLVFSNLVVVAPRGARGHALAAYDRESGALAWTGGDSEPHYSSPRLETLLGVRQILTFSRAGASGHDPGTGARLWEYPWDSGHPHVADPRVVGTDRVLISSGYGTGSRLVEIGRDEGGGWNATNLVWRSIRLKSKFANLLLKEGHAYGLDDGRLVCIDLADGSRRWQGERYGHGQLLLVSEVILVTAENGAVALVAATPEEFRELTRFQALEGKTWNPPALSGSILLVRNHREAAAYRLPTER